MDTTKVCQMHEIRSSYISAHASKHAFHQLTMSLNVFGCIDALANAAQLAKRLFTNFIVFLTLCQIISRINDSDIQSLQLFSVKSGKVNFDFSKY